MVFIEYLNFINLDFLLTNCLEFETCVLGLIPKTLQLQVLFDIELVPRAFDRSVIALRSNQLVPTKKLKKRRADIVIPLGDTPVLT